MVGTPLRQSPMVDKRGIPVVMSSVGSPRQQSTPSRQRREEDLDEVKLCSPRKDKSLMEVYDTFSDACHQSHLNHATRHYYRPSPRPQSSPSSLRDASTEPLMATPTTTHSQFSPATGTKRRQTESPFSRLPAKALKPAPAPSSTHEPSKDVVKPNDADLPVSTKPPPEQSAVDTQKKDGDPPADQAAQDCQAPSDTKDKPSATDENAQPAPAIQSKLEESQREIDEVNKLVKSLPSYYKLLHVVGKGTFSSVFKAVDLRHEYYDNNEWKDPKKGSKSHYVALKRIRGTSSPARIAREITILQDLRSCPCVASLITAFRHEDEVFVVLPYLEHDSFSRTFRKMEMDDYKHYLKSLFTGLMHLHNLKIMHRDIKPNNFLYNVRSKTGTLIDFGLAEREEAHVLADQLQPKNTNRPQAGTQAHHPPTGTHSSSKKTFPEENSQNIGYYRNDNRKSIRANRAGTKGFRAPEVLLRVPHQTTAIDVWSVGVIFLSMLTHRYPFFLSLTEADALIELCSVFGYAEMKDFASKHNRVFHTNVPTVPMQRVPWSDLLLQLNEKKIKEWGESDVQSATDLLDKCLTLDVASRITAKEALAHPFLQG